MFFPGFGLFRRRPCGAGDLDFSFVRGFISRTFTRISFLTPVRGSFHQTTQTPAEFATNRDVTSWKST